MIQHFLSGVKGALVVIALSCCSVISAQVTITGANCVVTGIIYQYDFKGNWKSNDRISICVEGGILAETNNSCTEKQTVSFVRVKWDEGKSSGKIIITSNAGTGNMNVNIVSKLYPGFIETSDKQTISYSGLAPSLSCTQATGGNCEPSFAYQWETSLDKIHWEKIDGATGKNLSLVDPLKQTSFFRRQVLENKSQGKAYSNEIQVFVTPETQNN